MATTTDLYRAITRQNFPAAKDMFTSIIKEKMTAVMQREYRATANEFIAPKRVNESNEKTVPFSSLKVGDKFKFPETGVDGVKTSDDHAKVSGGNFAFPDKVRPTEPVIPVGK